MKYRRLYIPGGIYFFTIVTYHRDPIFADPNAIKLFRNALQYTMQRMPFLVVGYVIMPDHLHYLWRLPKGFSNYSDRWRMIKGEFTREWRKMTAARNSPPVWQRRFWEHCIRDEDDFSHHLDYIHYNPVKHGLVNSPAEWSHSSFLQYVDNGVYPSDWGEDLPSLKVIEAGE